jgi:hypothetical protein
MLSLAELPIVAKIRRRLRRHGLPATLYAYGMRALNSAVSFRILRALVLARANPSFGKCPAGYSAGFASQQALHRFVREPDSDLSLKFVEQALSRGDQCFAICDGLSLAAYGWHSFRPTPTGLPGTQLHFDPHWVYRYKGFTLPRYRGQRLHAFGMTLALEHYLARGFRGLLTYVESTNFDSLKSCFRVGYRPFGSICVLQGFEQPLMFSTPGCQRMGFRLESYSLGPFGAP